MRPGLHTVFSAVLVVTVRLGIAIAADASHSSPAASDAKLSASFQAQLEREPGPVKAWVYFTDKGLRSADELDRALKRVAAEYDPHAAARRQMRDTTVRGGGSVFDWHDLPMNAAYVESVIATGARVHVQSRWLNAISVYMTAAQADQIAALPFVDQLEPVARARRVDVMNVRDIGAGSVRKGSEYWRSM